MAVSPKLNVQMIFKGMESSDAIKQYAEKRLSKLAKHVHHLTHCHFTFLVEKTDQIAQLHVISGEFDARGEAKEETVYAAIDTVTDKVIHQFIKHKEKHAAKGRPHHNEG